MQWWILEIATLHLFILLLILVTSSFWLLWIMLLIHEFRCTNIGIELLIYRVWIFIDSVLANPAKLFSKVVTPVCTLPLMYESFSYSINLCCFKIILAILEAIWLASLCCMSMIIIRWKYFCMLVGHLDIVLKHLHCEGNKNKPASVSHGPRDCGVQVKAVVGLVCAEGHFMVQR